jgi:ABC-type microcin C transport system permease subunit YejE
VTLPVDPPPDIQATPRIPQGEGPVERPSVSIFRKRVHKFRTIKRGYYSFVVLLVAYILSCFLPILISSSALIVRYQGGFYFPIARYYPAVTFGQQTIGEPDYRALAATFREQHQGNWALLLTSSGRKNETPYAASKIKNE